MAEDFADEVARLPPKVDFVEVVKQSLKELLGEPITLTVIHHLGGAEALQDPKVFEERLKALFGIGTEIILKSILKKLENSRKVERTT